MKRPTLSRLLAGLALAVTLGAASSPAAAYSNVVIFGDSLSDSGNNALVIGTDPGQIITGNDYVATFPYASGTYSNDTVWATRFAALLGLTAQPSLAGGTDFAYGGAVTRGGIFPPNLQKQVQLYLGTQPQDVGDTLFVIAGGGNNALAALDKIEAGAPQRLTSLLTARRYASDIGTMVDALQAAGAAHIVVWDTPDIGGTPLVQSAGGLDAAIGSSLAAAMNSALARRLNGEAGVLTFDVFGLLDTVQANPAAYGLSNTSDACGALQAACDPSKYLFWDGIHPTSAGHQIIAQEMLGLIAAPVPEPSAAWLFAMGGVALLLVRRRAG